MDLNTGNMKFKLYTFGLNVFILSLFIFCAPLVSAKGSDSTYVCHAESFTNNLAGETMAIPCQFKLQPNVNQFEWIQKGGLFRTIKRS
jgi:hypothetical protein